MNLYLRLTLLPVHVILFVLLFAAEEMYSKPLSDVTTDIISEISKSGHLPLLQEISYWVGLLGEVGVVSVISLSFNNQS